MGFEDLQGKTCRHGDVIIGLLTARICNPTSKNATLNRFAGTTYCTDLGPASIDEFYSAMDWLHERQPRIEQERARTHLGSQANLQHPALFDMSVSSVTGTHSPLTAYGFWCDNKCGHQ